MGSRVVQFTRPIARLSNHPIRAGDDCAHGHFTTIGSCAGFIQGDMHKTSEIHAALMPVWAYFSKALRQFNCARP